MQEYLHTWYKKSPKNNSVATYALSYEKRVEDNIYGNPMFKNITAFSLNIRGVACIHINAPKLAFGIYESSDIEKNEYNHKAIEEIFGDNFSIYE